MAESGCFETQLNSLMEIMSRALVRQICKIVDSDLASLRRELERALHDNAALADKMRVLESEVGTLRKAGARKRCRSVCIQTSEDAPPSINGIFGKEWCSSLWDGRPRTEAETVDVEPDMGDEHENNDDSNMDSIKEEFSEQEIYLINPTSEKRRKTSSVLSDPRDASEDVADDTNEDDDVHFISATDVDNIAPDSPSAAAAAAAATKLISMDGTVQHVIVSGDEEDDDNEEEGQLEFEQHCVPIEFMDGERGDATAFETQSKVEHMMEQDVLTGSEYITGSGRGGGHVFNYLDRFSMRQQAGPGDNSGKTDFTCPVCGKTFLRRNGLTLHMKSHQKQNSHTCGTCKIVFPQKNLLRTHKCLPPEKTPSRRADMRFRCEVCAKYFHSKANLKVHYAVHTGERPHTCSFCGRGFSQKGNLTTHERIHKGERPYMCTICGKSFTQKGNLTHHLAIHSKLNGTVRASDAKWR